MLKINHENGLTIIVIAGKITSENAPFLEKEIWDQIDFSTCENILIDAEHMTMISSAGLRIILKMRKLCPDVRISEVNADVYDVFEMTGFTEMIKIEKAYRKLSVDGCEKLGEGSNGVVYRYDPEIVVKVYRNANALAEIQRERKLARRALVMGIPTAIPFDVVKVGHTYGSVFELLNAKSFSKLIAAEPEKTDMYISLFVELLKKIHATEVEHEDFEDMKKIALGWAGYLRDYLPKDQSSKLISLIEAIPERRSMIHGDYHTNNVEMQDGEVILIDMDTLAFGHPVFEFASMFLSFVGFGELDHATVEHFMKLPYERAGYIWRKTLEGYFGTTDDATLKNIENKAKVIGYARLMRRTIKRTGFDDPLSRAIIENCRNRLEELLEHVSTLSF